MQLETDKKGMAAVFKEWQVPLVEELLSGKPMKSKEATDFLKEHDIRTEQKGRGTVSRASVINFLNYMVDQRLLDYSEKTAKGGHHRIYKMILTREEFAHKITDRFVNKLLEAFPQESLTFMWPQRP